MSDLFDPKVLSRMERLDLVARFVVEGYLSGRHKSPYRGFSVEFSQHRAYAPGDDTRRIDWKVYGKTERYYMKEYQQETNLLAYILVDTSKSMAYASGQLRKIEYAKMAAACLAFLILDQQDSVGVMAFGDDLRVVMPPTAGGAAFSDICEAVSPLEPEGEGDIAGALHKMAQIFRRRGVVAVISDFLADADATLKGLEHLRFDGHDVIAIQVLDPAERTFPFSGTCVFEGLEGGGRVLTDAARIRRQYTRALEAFVDKLHSGCAAAQADHLLADTSESLDKVLAGYLLARGKRR